MNVGRCQRLGGHILYCATKIFFPDCTGHFFGKLYCPFLFPDTSVLLKLRHHSDLDSYNEELMMYCQVLKRFKHSVLLTYYKKLEELGIEPGPLG